MAVDDRDFKAKISRMKVYARNLPRIAGNEAINFFKESFRRQGWLDERLERWKPRSSKTVRNKGRAILINTGRLRRSIRIVSIVPGRVRIGTDVPYAEIHNKGGNINRRVNIRAHTRRSRRGVQQVRSHARQMNLNIPQRQFMGESNALKKQLEKMIERDITRIFK